MRVSILLQIIGDDGAIGPAEEVGAFEKATERPENLGLSIAEGKAMLAAVQARTVLRFSKTTWMGWRWIAQTWASSHARRMSSPSTSPATLAA